MKNNSGKGKEYIGKSMGIETPMKQLFSMRMIQRFSLCGFIVARIWVRLSIPGLLKLFLSRIC